MTETYVDRETAAELLGVTPRTIDRYVAENLLTKYKVPVRGRSMLARSEVESLLQPAPVIHE